MTTAVSGQKQVEPEVEAFARTLIDDVAAMRRPDLFVDNHPDALYYLPNRHGISAIVLRTTDLSQDQLVALLRWRLVQYLLVGFLDAGVLYRAGLTHEPLSLVSPEDLHVIVGSADTGEILCYTVLQAIEAPANATLRTEGRSPFPVEKVHGQGIYGHLPIAPGLPIARVRELGRFMKNQQPGRPNDAGTRRRNLMARAPVEVGVALTHILTGSARREIGLMIGDIEDHVAKRNFDFFEWPLVTLQDTEPVEPAGSYHVRLKAHTFCPFAILTADLLGAIPRLQAIERALALPGAQAMFALFDLKATIHVATSSLVAEHPRLADAICASFPVTVLPRSLAVVS